MSRDGHVLSKGFSRLPSALGRKPQAHTSLGASQLVSKVCALWAGGELAQTGSCGGGQLKEVVHMQGKKSSPQWALVLKFHTVGRVI